MPTGQTSPGPSSPIGAEKKTPAPTARLNGQPNQTFDRDINGKQVATTMKDGTKLYPQFQQGGCKAKRRTSMCGSHPERLSLWRL